MDKEIKEIVEESFKKIQDSLTTLMGSDVVVNLGDVPKGRARPRDVIPSFSVVNQVIVENVSDNDLWMFVDRNTSIFMGGKLLMMPDSVIKEEMEGEGGINQSILDAQKEIFNVIIGALDDVFREKIREDLHLVQGRCEVFSGDGSPVPDREFDVVEATLSFEGMDDLKLSMMITPGFLESLSGKDVAEEVGEKVEEVETEEEQPKAPSPGLPEDMASIVAGAVARKNFPAVQYSATLGEAKRKLERYGSSFVLVLDGLEFKGMLTIADINRGLSPFLEDPLKEYCRDQDINTQKFKVEWFMRVDVPWVEPETPLPDFARLMAEEEIPYLPVCMDGYIVGVVHFSDVIALLLGTGGQGS